MNLDPIFSAPQLIVLAGALQGLLLCVASFFWHRGNRTSNRLFGGVIGLLTLMMLAVSQGFGGATPRDAPYGVIHAWGALALLLGPMIYFYIRTSVDTHYLFKGSRLLHAVPALLHLTLLIPLLFVDADLRAAYVDSYIDRQLFRSAVPEIRIGFIVTSAYAVAAFIWIRRYETHITQVASFGDATRIRWLKWFTGLVVVLLFLLGLFAFPEAYRPFAAISLTAFMSTLVFIALVRPTVFHGIPSALRLTEETSSKAKYEGSQLDDTQKESHLAALLAHFDEQKPYLQQELTLRDVAAALSIPHRYVSQVVNEKLDQHFMDFVNSYRVEAAKQMLLAPEWQHLTIDGIAGEAGFKSRSAFYTAFKKVTGTTPGAFRKSAAVY
ncbi:MAG: helix-turn-helix domain-containing protein [Bacteroidota bacterium]